MTDGDEQYSVAELRRMFGLRFPGLRLRVDLVRDQFGAAIDYRIPARRGEFFEFDESVMGYACYSGRLARKLLAQFPDVVLFAGDGDESVMHVPNDVFPRFARAAGVKTRRVASPAQREAALRNFSRPGRGQFKP